MSDRTQKLVAFAKRLEPDGGYFGPETLVDYLGEESAALSEFKTLIDGATAEELGALEEQDEYGWIVAGAADELDLFPDDPRLFMSDDQLAQIPDEKLLGELCSACIVNDSNAVRNIASRIEVNKLDHNKQSALCYAVGNNHSACVEILLANGADPNLVQNWGNTAMHICATSVSSKQIWQMLIANGGNPDVKNERGETAAQKLRSMERSDWMA